MRVYLCDIPLLLCVKYRESHDTEDDCAVKWKHHPKTQHALTSPALLSLAHPKQTRVFVIDAGCVLVLMVVPGVASPEKKMNQRNSGLGL